MLWATARMMNMFGARSAGSGTISDFIGPVVIVIPRTE